MKFTLTSAFIVALAKFATAHYTFPDFIVNGAATTDWEYVRITANHYSQGPLTNVNDPEFRCYELDLVNTASQTSTATVTAGATIGFKADAVMGHPGYFDAYLSPASPAANSEAAGTGKTWYKIWDWAPTWTKTTGLTFASENIQQVTFTIPKSTPNGQYLLRLEQIALHVASSYQGAQFYIGCAQINVVGSVGSKAATSSYLTSFPGAYTGYEPGILIDIYSLPANYTGYVAPGPAVWQG